MIAGMGVTIMYSSLDIAYIFHYFVFGCLLIVVLIDYQYLLKGIEPLAVSPKKETVLLRKIQQKPAHQRKPLFTRSAKHTQQQPVMTVLPESIIELKNVSDTILQKMQLIIDDLGKKTLQIERLEQKFEEQKKFDYHQKIESNHSDFQVTFPQETQERDRHPVQDISTEEEILLKEKIENHLVIDELNDIAAVVQRGIFKEVSNSFAGFLGYERTELLQKNFFIFIAPRGYDDARKYYLNRLKGITSNSFRTILLTKANTEMLVEITVTSTIYKGDSAEFLSIKVVNNSI